MLKKCLMIGMCLVISYATNLHANADVSVEERSALIKEIFALNGADQVIGEFPDLALEMFSSQIIIMYPPDHQALKQIINDSFAKERVDEIIFHYFLKNYNHEHLMNLKEMVHQDITKKVRYTSVEIAKKDYESLLRTYQNAIANGDVKQDLLKLVSDIDSGLKSSDLLVARTKHIYHSVAVIANMLLPANKQKSTEEILKNDDEFIQNVESHIRQSIEMYYYYSMIDLTTEEADQYVEILVNDSNVWFAQSLAVATKNAINQCLDFAGEKVFEYLQNNL